MLKFAKNLCFKTTFLWFAFLTVNNTYIALRSFPNEPRLFWMAVFADILSIACVIMDIDLAHKKTYGLA